MPELTDRTDSNVSNIIFTPDLQHKLQQLNVKKSPGLDKMWPHVLKSLIWTCCALVHYLPKIVCVRKVSFLIWKDASVTPIFKKGDKTLPNDYSPPILTNIVCKVIVKIVRDNLMSHLTATALLSDNQHEFWPGHSCPSNLLTALDN